MTIKIDVWSDFVCPYCFLAASSLDTLKQHYEIDLHWHSFELRPAGSPPMPEFYRKRIEESQPRLIETARDVYGLELSVGPFGINSRPALIGAKYAEAEGKGAAYHKAVLQAYWQKAQDISDLAILSSIAESVGLDSQAFQAALSDPDYDTAVTKDVMLAQHYGMTGVPAMIFGEKYLVVGAQPYELFEQVIHKLQEEEKSS